MSSIGQRNVTVFGATGQQGGSVVAALLSAGGFKVRGFTRDPSAPKAVLLSEKGVELIQGDVDDAASVAAAVKGAYAVFAVTNRPGSPAETPQARTMALASRKAGVQHFLWSTLPNSEADSGGKYSVPHWMGKAVVDEYVRALHFPHFTFICPSFYFSNFQNFVRANADGEVVFNFLYHASTWLPCFSVSDLGKVVPGILNDPDKWGRGSYVRFAPSYMLYGDMVKAFEASTGKTAKINVMSPEEFIQKMTMMPMPVRTSLCLGAQMINEFGFFPKDVDSNNASQLADDLTTWEGWLTQTSFEG